MLYLFSKTPFCGNYGKALRLQQLGTNGLLTVDPSPADMVTDEKTFGAHYATVAQPAITQSSLSVAESHQTYFSRFQSFSAAAFVLTASPQIMEPLPMYMPMCRSFKF